jgi:hypothetical protein
VQAELNFVRPTEHAPRVDLTEPGWGRQLSLERRSLDIAELEIDREPAAALAARGFAAIPFAGGPELERASRAERARFAEAVAGTVRAFVGARGVFVLGDSLLVRRSERNAAAAPLFVCHSDFDAVSAASKFAAVQRANPRARGARRFAIYNSWWLASGAPPDAPLALCDAGSVAPADLVTGSAVIRDEGGGPVAFEEVAYYRYSPRQAWSWYPDLAADRLLLFAAHDSDPAVASQVPHSAFANPACPPGAPGRVSVECRCVAYW